MSGISVAAGQIWQDDCYYLDPQSGECMRKYLLVLAVDANTQDAITVVFTSQPNGLPETPTCHIGNPRSGFYLGIPGGKFFKETWLDFSNLKTLDAYDFKLHYQQGRKHLIEQALPKTTFCEALRCIMQMQDDITKKQWRLLGDTVAALNCP
ncbi:hypothetical protein [Methylophilus sp. YYY-1]|uniref:hypothetical protein n=1 Tax=Methylophilus sp. YYY-1 TaxID=2682087 RepID=UPI0023B28D3D|nr:hypothetical protein [Methylophilus sp. YYY-1]MDF0377473.1 hypothetical protein [Methylophilus sp. YYY-1]